MIRKAIIVVLTLGAMGVVILAVFMTSSPRTVMGPIHISQTKGSIIVVVVVDEQVQGPMQLQEWQKSYGNEGLAFAHGAGPMKGQEFRRWWGFRCNLLVLFLLFVIYPTIAFIRGPLRRYRRHRRGECIGCGYDLTGNESGVCPECGKRVRTQLTRPGEKT